MSTNAVMLAIRFLMELASIITIGYWGWLQSDGVLRFLLAIGLPIAAAAIWGTFAVPEDPTRSGKTLVPTPGIVRLILELALFGLSVYLLISIGSGLLGWLFCGVIVIHYALSYDRILWLLER